MIPPHGKKGTEDVKLKPSTAQYWVTPTTLRTMSGHKLATLASPEKLFSIRGYIMEIDTSKLRNSMEQKIKGWTYDSPYSKTIT